MKKKVIAILICLMFITETIYALPATIWENREEEKISSSITHESILRFTPEGWFNINVVKADISDPLNQVKLLRSQKGMSERDTVKNLVQNSGAIAGINASFFNSNSTTIGTIIEDGRIITTSNTKDDVPSLVFDYNSKPYFSMNSTEVHLNDLSQQFSLINVPINRFGYNGDNPISILTPDWGQTSIGAKYNKNIIEVLVIDNIVHDIRQGGAPFTIPQNGYVISVIKGTLGYRSVDKMQIGDNLMLIYPDESFKNTKLSLPGGTVILKNGAVVNQGLNVKGKHPRSAVGFDSTGNIMYLVSVDGRDTSYPGVTLQTLGEIMSELGCYNALNLDGGGSTNLAIHYKGEENAKIVNDPSEKGRKVITGIGITTEPTPLGSVDTLEINLKNKHFFVLNGREISVNAKDINQNPVAINNNDIIWSVEGVNGVFEGYKFIPQSAGKGKITATLGEKSVSEEITVVDNVADLSTDTEAIYLEPGEMVDIPEFTATDTNGNSAIVEDIGLSVYGNIGEIMGDKFVAGSNPSTGYISAVFSGGVENIPIFVGSKKIPMNDFADAKRMTGSVAPKGLNGKAVSSGGVIKLNYDFSKNTDTRACYANFDPKNATSIPVDAVSIGLTVQGDGKGTWIRGVVNDGKRDYTIDFVRNLDTVGKSVVSAVLPKRDAPLKLVRIYAVENRPEALYSGSVSFSNLTMNFPLPLANIPEMPEATNFKDPHENSDISGDKITIASEPISSKPEIKIDYNRFLSAIQGNTVISFNGFSKTLAGLAGRKNINANGLYSVNNTDNAEILTLSANKGSIWTTASPQWPSIQKLKDSNKSNILVLLDKPVAKIVDDLEADLFRKYMADIKESGKNVIVVQKSERNVKYIKDGVRYLEIKGNSLNKPEDIKGITQLELTFSGDDFAYSYRFPCK